MMIGKNVSWTYQNKHRTLHVLKNITFELKAGRITTFMGQSGAGKTTLLKCLANLHSEYEGEIMCDGRNLKEFSPQERASTVGFVLQQFHLFPHLNVLHNCSLALLKVLSMPEKKAEERVLEILSSLGIASFAHSFPPQLSGGQQQRVAIARSLVLKPKILLLDEPTSALDPDSKKSLETLLMELNAQGITIAISSHDMPFIRRIRDRVYFMENGEIVEEWDKNTEDLAKKEKIQQFLDHD